MIVIFSHAQIVTKVRKQNGFINQQFIIFFNNSPNHEHTECWWCRFSSTLLKDSYQLANSIDNIICLGLF